jgi:hypothetical protein
LIGFVGDSVSYRFTKHHLRTIHEVLHDILKLRYECLSVNNVKVDLGISGNLNPLITSNIVNESSNVNGVIAFPLTFTSELIKLKLEEENLTGASHNQCILIDQVHCSQVLVIHFLLIELLFSLILVILNYFDWHSV